jgi:hypothetical protein
VRSNEDKPSMGEPRPAPPALLVVAAFSRHAAALGCARGALEDAFGPVARVSDVLPFDQTDYYAATMGSGLGKQFFTFGRLLPPERLAAAKLRTNALERELAGAGTYPEPRPLNLDPGLLTLGKFMLATTKDQAHRIYLGDGVFAEVTLRFHRGAWEPWPWTYADYRQPAVLDFLYQAREDYRRLLPQAGH